MKQQRIYRLVIIYPEGSREPGWRPSRWDEWLSSLPWLQRRKAVKEGFRWPRERMFLSSSSAYGRAGLLRWFGADVEVLPSDPVTWPNYDDAAVLGDDGWASRHGCAMRWTPGTEVVADYRDQEYTAEVVAVLKEVG